MTIAFVFPGQGSQSVGMLADLAEIYPVIKSHYQMASQVLDFDLWDLTMSGPEEKLNETQITQPAILTASVALWRVWSGYHSDKTPAFFAGHSLGEYSALVAAESINFVDAVRLTYLRGRYMADASPAENSAMVAILGLENDAAEKACNIASEKGVVACANYNAPGQIVISGEKAAVEEAARLCKEAGAKRVLLLKVSAPSHCDLMRSAADKLAGELNAIDIQLPKIPVIHNADVQPHSDVTAIKQSLLQQLYSPVRWVESIEWMLKQGVTDFYECGPGKVLTGLDKRIAKEANHIVVSDELAKAES